MQMVLSGIQNCEVYLDDIVIYSMTWEDHIRTLEAVFKCLNEASLTLNLAKCEFARAVITYLGKLVGQGQVRPVEAKVSSVVNEIFYRSGSPKTRHREASWLLNSFILRQACLYIWYQRLCITGGSQNDQRR